MEIEVKYKAGHSYNETWLKGEYHCPDCGVKGLWEEQGEGDYYVGASFCCHHCGSVFTMQYREGQSYTDKQRVEAIKAVESCPYCKGTKKINGFDCGHCHGTGKDSSKEDK